MKEPTMTVQRNARLQSHRSADVRARGRSGPRTKLNPATAWFPELGRSPRSHGVGVGIAIAEATGDHPRVRIHRRSSFSNKAGERHRQRLLEEVPDADLAKFLAAFGQRRRLRICRAI